jgi:hypothetical protein
LSSRDKKLRVFWSTKHIDARDGGASRQASPPTVARDAFGNALGGVRTPFLDVPTATYVPTDTVAHVTTFSGFCILYGYSVPFSEDTLDSLYRNHGNYVFRVVNASTRLVLERFWLLPDALDVLHQAVHSDVP